MLSPSTTGEQEISHKLIPTGLSILGGSSTVSQNEKRRRHKRKEKGWRKTDDMTRAEEAKQITQ